MTTTTNSAQQVQVFSFALVRFSQYTRDGQSHFVLHGHRLTDVNQSPGDVRTLRIGADQCSLQAADVIALAQAGDKLSIGCRAAEPGQDECEYVRASLSRFNDPIAGNTLVINCDAELDDTTVARTGNSVQRRPMPRGAG